MKRIKFLLSLVLCLSMLAASVVCVHAETEDVTSLLGYQLTPTDESGAYSLRLVGVINATAEELTTYDGVGFDVTMTFTDHTDWAAQTGSFTRKTVYSEIYVGEGMTLEPTDMNVKGGYFFLLPINGLYEDVGGLSLSVFTFYIKNGKKIPMSETPETFPVEKTADTKTVVFAPDAQYLEGIPVDKVYNLGDGAYEYAYSGVTVDAYKNVTDQLDDAGYYAYHTNTINGNSFATYTKGYMQINVAYYPNYVLGYSDGNYYTGALRVVYSPKGYLPEKSEPTYEKVTDATVTQLGTLSSKEAAPGESYVIQLEDGSFVVIDGGGAYTATVNNDMQTWMNFLTVNKPASHEKPRVTWMFTHAHGDHIALALSFLEKYSNSIQLDMVCYNFPELVNTDAYQSYVKDGDELVYKYPTDLKDILDKQYPNATRYIFHTGQVLYLAGCKIEFLMTHEDIYPAEMGTLNKTCGAWKMTFKAENDKADEFTGNSFLVLGDSEKVNCGFIDEATNPNLVQGFLAAVYDGVDSVDGVLDCDMVQAAHHGLNGATSTLYGKIEPEIVFWPIDYATRGVEKSGTNNDVWDNTVNHAWLNNTAIRHYYADTTVTIVAQTLEKRTMLIMDEPFDGFSEDSDQDMDWDWGA